MADNPEEDFPALSPLNMSDDLEEMTAVGAGCAQINEDNDRFGIFTVLTPIGFYDFCIDQQMANHMVQVLRKFISGDAPSLDNEDAPSA